MDEPNNSESCGLATQLVVERVLRIIVLDRNREQYSIRFHTAIKCLDAHEIGGDGRCEASG